MKKLVVPILLCLSTLVGGCSSLTRFENVAGTWSCPLVEGVCANISTIDSSLLLDGVNPTQALGQDAFPQQSGPVYTEAAFSQSAQSPGRSSEEVARIVFAPSIDRRGNFHGERELFAVMRNGLWDVSDEGEAHHTPTHLRPVNAVQRERVEPAPTEPTSTGPTDLTPTSERANATTEDAVIQSASDDSAAIVTSELVTTPSDKLDHAADESVPTPRVKPQTVAQNSAQLTTDVADYVLSARIPVISEAEHSYEQETAPTGGDREGFVFREALKPGEYTTEEIKALSVRRTAPSDAEAQ